MRLKKEFKGLTFDQLYQLKTGFEQKGAITFEI